MTFGQLTDLARDVADYRRYGFKFEESLQKVIGERTDMTDSDRVAVRKYAEAAWKTA